MLDEQQQHQPLEETSFEEGDLNSIEQGQEQLLQADDSNSSFFEQEFTEQDVLPFLLQAQDIISKLESRVVELETDLNTIHCKYEHDRNEWLVGLSQKDQFINHLSSKLQKTEFNSKESITLLSDLTEDVSLETMKSTITLCLNYLRGNQSHPVVSMPAPVVAMENDLEEGELERRQQAVTEWRRHNKSHDNQHSNSLMDGLSSCDSSLSLSSASILPKEEEEEEEIEVVSYSVNNDTNCMNCKQLLSQLDQQIEQKAYLKRDLSSLASALSEEEEIRNIIEQDKEILEQDVNTITSSLFLHLNQLLMEEVTEKEDIIQLNRETQGKLSTILDFWDNRDLRLKQVKELLIQLDSSVHQTSTTITARFSTINRLANRTSTSSILLNNQPIRLEQTNTSVSKHVLTNNIKIDGFVFDEYQQHVKTIMSNKSSAMTPFIKRILAEDVEPCLFFQQSQGWWKSPWFRKRLLDAISKNKCEITTVHESVNYSNNTTTTTSSSMSSPTNSHISTNSSSNNQTTETIPKTKCTCCNLLRTCEFKMRLPAVNNTQQPWLPIDRFCRDRLVAVCEYYSYMTHLKLLLNNNASTTVLNTFKQVMNYRRKMSLARIGSIALFDLEDDDNRSNSACSSSANSFKMMQQKRRSSSRKSLLDDNLSIKSNSSSILDGQQIIIIH